MYASSVNLISQKAVRRDVIGRFLYPPPRNACGHDFDVPKIEGRATAEAKQLDTAQLVTASPGAISCCLRLQNRFANDARISS